MNSEKQDGSCRLVCGCKVFFPESDLDRGQLRNPCDIHKKLDVIAQLRIGYIVGAKLKEFHASGTNLKHDQKLDASGNVTTKSG